MESPSAASIAMADYDDGSPSPTPADCDPHLDLQRASLSDMVLHLRRMAKDRPADGHSRHRQQQRMYVINMDHEFPPVMYPDGTGRRSVIITSIPNLLHGIHPRHHHRAIAATPYRRTEHQQRHNKHRRQSPAPHDEAATKVVCLSKMLSAADRLDDDRFYLDFLEDITKEARKFGGLVMVVVPRPVPGASRVVAGVGKVFLEYVHLEDAASCRRRLDGSQFRGKKIVATFCSQADRTGLLPETTGTKDKIVHG